MMYDETFIYAQTYTFSLEGQVNRLLMNVTCLFYLDYIFDIVLGFLFSSRTFYEQPNKSNKHIQIIG